MMQLSKQLAVAFAETGHLFHHVGELGDVEGRDGGDFADWFGSVCCGASPSDVRS